MLHIVFLASWYPSRVFPTNGDFIQRHAESVSLKNKVTVLHVVSDPNLNDNIEIVTEETLGVKSFIAYVKPTRNKLKKVYLFLKAFILLFQKTAAFDIVHVHKLYPAGIIALFLKVFNKKSYLITEHHSIYHKAYHSDIGFFEKPISKLISKNATFMCPVSTNLAEAMIDFGLKGNYRRVPNVVKTDFFQFENKKSKIFTLLHISNMETLKNVDGILNVVKKLEEKEIKFKFIFIGGEKKYFFNLLKRKDINAENIEFIEYVVHTEINNYYQRADVFVLFSNIENLPCVILESFSSGTAVISSKVGGISEYFPSNFGVLINKQNEDELAKAILSIYKNEKMIVKGSVMHQYVLDNFSLETISNDFNEIYKEILLK